MSFINGGSEPMGLKKAQAARAKARSGSVALADSHYASRMMQFAMFAIVAVCAATILMHLIDITLGSLSIKKH